MIININCGQDFELLTFRPKGAVGLTSGCFDLFHSMHLAYLQKCRRMCDMLIVGIDGDDFVRRTKGPGRPIVPEHHRIMLIDALKCVDVTFIMGSLTDWATACEEFRPGVIFKNGEHNPESIINPTNAEIVIVPDVIQADSTTRIIEEIKKRHEHKP